MPTRTGLANCFFGVLLGCTAYLGYLLSLPLDIQHVVFGSANLGYLPASRMDALLALLPYFVFVLLIRRREPVGVFLTDPVNGPAVQGLPGAHPGTAQGVPAAATQATGRARPTINTHQGARP